MRSRCGKERLSRSRIDQERSTRSNEVSRLPCCRPLVMRETEEVPTIPLSPLSPLFLLSRDS